MPSYTRRFTFFLFICQLKVYYFVNYYYSNRGYISLLSFIRILAVCTHLKRSSPSVYIYAAKSASLLVRSKSMTKLSRVFVFWCTVLALMIQPTRRLAGGRDVRECQRAYPFGLINGVSMYICYRQNARSNISKRLYVAIRTKWYLF